MDFNNGDPFDGASPIASNSQEPENYDDLLGIRVPVEQVDLATSDFDSEFAKSSYTAPIADMGGPQDQISVTTDDPQGATMELCDTLAKPVVTNANSASRRKQKPCTIKKEVLDEPLTLGIPMNTIDDPVEISDTEDPDSIYKYGIKMSDGVIILSDGEDPEDIMVLDDASTSVAVKKEDPDVELLGATRSLLKVSDFKNKEPSTASVPNLGKSFLRTPIPRAQRTAAEIERMQQIQRLYAEKALGRNLGPAGARAVATAKTLQSSKPDSQPDDGFAWMSEVIVVDDGPAADFSEVKKAYKAKRKARKNTLEDDVQFKNAQNQENQRLKRLTREAADTDSDDEAEESDDGLFLPQEPSLHSKRPFSSMMDTNDDDDDDVDAVPVETSIPKRPKPAENNLSTKKSRAKALRKELRCNMLAGIEASILKDQKRIEEKAAKAADAGSAGNGFGQASKKGRKAKPPDLSAKRTQTGRMNNIGSLTTSNIYEDSNANLDRQALPVTNEKKKKEFLSSLIANVPLEDKKQANSDRIDILKASRLLGLRKVVPDGRGNWKLKGMKSSLFHYQMRGAACMHIRETGEQDPYGGILADEMGLGKTIEMIATMTANRQTDPEEPKCTLIVCSPALMGQWEAELELHVEPDIFKRVSRYHSNSKTNGKGAETDLERADVFLTTYGEVVKSYPKCEIPKEVKTPAEKEAWWSKEWDEKRGLLHRTQFHRVVLDEAQVIKNHQSQTSIACRALMAKHRWAISATPTQNRLEELFPFFKFLRVRHTGSMGVFRQNFCGKDDDVCHKRLHSFLAGVMIRRTHQDKLLGAPLLKLPKNTQQTIQLKFNSVERHIYEIVRLKCIKAINAVARNGTLEEDHRMVIIYFQRLRQTVAHLFMVQEVLQKELSIDDVEAARKELLLIITDTASPENQMLRGLKKMIAEKEKDIDTLDTVPLYFNPDETVTVPKAGKKSSNLISRFSKVLREMKRNSKWSELRERTLCHMCGESPEEPIVTSCFHLYCKDCLERLAYEASELYLDQTSCHKCGTKFSESQPCKGLKELEIPDLSASVFQGDKDKAPVKKTFKLTMNYVDSKEYGVVLSTKMLAVKAQLEKWIGEDPDRKIIVFTEWLMVMHVVSRICQTEGWTCCHYNGKQSHRARDQSLNAFRDPNSEVKILIASLKCGGTGLNLTAASRVICVDLWFNSCVEQQAFARVHRIGQEHETQITRFVVENTIDERLVEMQEEKKEVISTAMDDRSVLANLTLPELMKLFGPVAYKDSKPFILVDDSFETRPKRSTAPRAGEDPTASAN